MVKKHYLAVLLLACLPGMVSAQDAKAVVTSAAKAMGIADISAVGSYLYSGSGASFEFGEARAPDSPWAKRGFSSYRRVIDFDAGGSLETFVRTPETEIRRIPFVAPYGQAGKQFEIWMTPLAFLKGALSGNATVESKTVGGKPVQAVSFMIDKRRITGYLNRENQLEQVETRIDNPLLGDTLVESFYSDYKDFEHGLIFPSRFVQKEGGYPVLDLTVTDAVPNVIAAVIEPIRFYTLGIGEPRYHGPFLGPPLPVSVDHALVADGVYYLTGGTHHSVVVEFNDYLVVIEAPLDEARSQAVIADIRKIFGSKPIRYVVNTHAHVESAGGLRTYAAEGATIITQAINKPYYEKVFALPHTISPDKLSQARKRALIEGVAEKRILTDGTHVIELYHVPNEHADGMLVAYLPKDKIVIEADLYAARDPEVEINEKGEIRTLPKRPVSPYAAALADTLDRLKIGYRTILGLQGRAAQKAELLEDVKTH